MRVLVQFVYARTLRQLHDGLRTSHILYGLRHSDQNIQLKEKDVRV